MAGSSDNTRGNLAVFPGMFDPTTLGHVDIVRRGANIFGQVIVAVGCNPEKSEWFSPEERVDMMRTLTSDLPNVRVESYSGLTMDYVRRVGARVILRGIRDSVDLRSELQVANTNLLVGGVETVFLMTSDQHALTSSTLIKQVIEMGGCDQERLGRLIPRTVIERLERRQRDLKPGRRAAPADSSLD
ncbi:MAG: pantetheine-phosphate adenylyltransferase [bacterium]|nr:pantetheine-phosphate adenylyltransferase [bacterium]